MPAKKSSKVKEMTLLRTPCVCMQVWCVVVGTPKKRLSVRCLTRGHLLKGKASATKTPYRELVRRSQKRGGTPMK